MMGVDLLEDLGVNERRVKKWDIEEQACKDVD
jgi:hypothetical protein